MLGLGLHVALARASSSDCGSAKARTRRPGAAVAFFFDAGLRRRGRLGEAAVHAGVVDRRHAAAARFAGQVVLGEEDDVAAVGVTERRMLGAAGFAVPDQQRVFDRLRPEEISRPARRRLPLPLVDVVDAVGVGGESASGVSKKTRVPSSLRLWITIAAIDVVRVPAGAHRPWPAPGSFAGNAGECFAAGASSSQR